MLGLPAPYRTPWQYALQYVLVYFGVARAGGSSGWLVRVAVTLYVL